MPAKIVENYTTAMVSKMVAAYTNVGITSSDADIKARDEVVKTLAREMKPDMRFDNAVRSVRAKLVAEKVYISKVVKSKVTGEPAMKKADMAEIVAKVSGLKVRADSIEKMDKGTIAAFKAYFEEKAAAETESAETESAETESAETESAETES